LEFRTRTVIPPVMKIELHGSFLLPLEFLRCLDLYLGIVASWMMERILSRSYQILHIKDITFYVAGTRMEVSASISLAYFQ